MGWDRDAPWMTCGEWEDKCIATKTDDPFGEVERLREALNLALRQWSMYAEMVERIDGFDLESEKSPEGEMYRAAKALANCQ